MGKEYTLQEALRLAIRAEKNSLEFYRKASVIATDAGSKRVFELLASEELKHLKAFFQHYQGTDLGRLDDFLNTPTDLPSAIHCALEKGLESDVQEPKALEIALKEEKACIELYSILAKDIVDPLVRRVFEAVIREGKEHYEIIEDEYMRIMRMVDRSDQDIYVRE